MAEKINSNSVKEQPKLERAEEGDAVKKWKVEGKGEGGGVGGEEGGGFGKTVVKGVEKGLWKGVGRLEPLGSKLKASRSFESIGTIQELEEKEEEGLEHKE